MKFSLLSTTLLASLFVKNAEAGLWKAKVGSTWNYVLGHKINLATEKAEVLEIDVNKSADLIKEYHNAGKKVICYFSGGTIEDFRDDYDDYASVKGLIRNTYDEWDDEKWLDFRLEGIKPLIKRRMQMAVNKKCDGIEVDNVDAYQISDVRDEWTDPITREDTIVFLKWLGTTAHNLGIAIGLKNVNGLLDEVSPYFDFAINEECYQYKDECRRYRKFLDSGKPVYAVAYNGLKNNRKKLCEQLEGVSDISMIVKESDSLVQEGTIFDYNSECKGITKKATTTKKTTTKKATTKKTTTKKATTTKKTTTTVKKTTTKKTTVKKTTTTKKNVPKVTTTKKTTTKKNVPKTTTKAVKKTTTKKVSSKKTTTKAVKKTTTKKVSSKKTTTKAVKKTTTKKAVPKVTTTKKAAKKTTTKKAAKKTTKKITTKKGKTTTPKKANNKNTNTKKVVKVVKKVAKKKN